MLEALLFRPFFAFLLLFFSFLLFFPSSTSFLLHFLSLSLFLLSVPNAAVVKLDAADVVGKSVVGNIAFVSVDVAVLSIIFKLEIGSIVSVWLLRTTVCDVAAPQALETQISNRVPE